MGFPPFSLRRRLAALRRLRYLHRPADEAVGSLQRLEPRLLLAATVSGVVWHDADGDGVRGAGEPGLAGWTVYVDTDNDGVMDAAEQRQVSDANGDYTLTGVSSGTQRIRIDRPTGWEQTTALTSATVNMLLPISNAREMVYDSARDRLYVTSNGEVARFDLSAWTMLAPISVGYNLGGLDITPDGSELYIADKTSVGTKGTFRRVNLVDGTVTTEKFDHNTFGSIYDVAIGPDGKAKLSTTGTFGRVYEYDPTAETITEFSIGETANFVIERSADRQTFLFDDVQTSPTDLVTFDSVTGQVIQSIRDGDTFGPMVGVNRNGTILAIENTTGIKIQDRFFNALGFLPNVTGGHVFDPLLDVLYAVNPSNDQIVAYDTNTLGQLYTIPIGENVSTSGIQGAGDMEISADGQFLFLITPTGVRVINRNAVAQPGAFVESLTTSSVETGRDFGVLPAELSAVSGYLWVDGNADGARDAGEAPLAGRAVYLDLDNDGQFDAGEPEQITDSLGAYRFDGLLPGTYAVRTSLTPAMQSTYPLALAPSPPSDVLAMADAQDIVYDALRNRFYVSTDTGLIRRWDVASRSMLSPINAGTLLNGMDISPDYSSLYVADEAVVDGLSSIKKINLDTGGIMTISFPTVPLAGAWDVAVAGGRVYITGAGNNPINPFTLDLANDTIVPETISSMRTMDRSGDRATLLGSRTSGPLTLYDATDADTVASMTLAASGNGVLAAVNFDGSMFAYQNVNGTFVLDRDFAGIELFQSLSSGLVFDPDRPVVWMPSALTDHLIAMDIARNRPVASLPVGADVLASESRFGPGGMATGGGYVALITEDGVRLWDIDAEGAPSQAVTLGVGQISVNNDFGVLFDGVSLAVTPATAGESGGAGMTYTFTRGGDTSAALAVQFSIAGTATFGTDYTQTGADAFDGATGTVTFAPGASTATVTIHPVADTDIEPYETVSIAITPGSGYSNASPGEHVATIIDDDAATVTIARSPSFVTEDGGGNIVYTVTRNKTAGPLMVNLLVAGSAAFGTDYTQSGAATFTASTATVHFADGVATATVTIDPTTDAVVELSETVILSVWTGSGYQIGAASSATGTITNDDIPSVTVSISVPSRLENGSPNLGYTFTRDTTIGTLVVDFSVAGTATLANDYTVSGATTFTATSGTVTFAEGVSQVLVTVNPSPDTVIEPDETVVLTLTSSAAYTLGTPSSATGTITNDDFITVTLASAALLVAEDALPNAALQFTRSSPLGALTVNFTVGGTASFNEDYTQLGAASFDGTSGTVVFADGSTTATVSLDPTADTLIEPNETVTVTLVAGTGYILGTSTAATTTLINDDQVALSVAIDPGSISENGGTATATVTRTGPTTGSLLVYLASSDVTEATVPATVTIPAGAASQTFTITGLDDVFNDGDQTIAIEARLTPLPMPITLDPNFGTGGIAATPTQVGGILTDAAMAIQLDGKIIIATADSNTSSWRVTRLLANGQPDTTFGTGGSVTTITGSFPVPYRILIQPDGKIIVGGKITSGVGTAALVRYNPDGTLDSTYGTDGRVTTTGITGWIEDMALGSDGKLLLAVRANGSAFFRAARVGTTGVVENVYVFNSINESTAAILPLPDGRFLLAGDDAVARVNANGTLDPTFGQGGIRSFGNTNLRIYEIAFDSDGSIVAGASVGSAANSTNFAVARLSFDGVIDTTFGTGGVAVVDLAGFDDTPTGLIIQPDRKIILTGGTETADGLSEAGFVRLLPTGAIDPTFDGDGIYRRSVLASTSEISFASLLQPDGKLVSFHGWGTDNRVMRLIADTQPGTTTAAVTVTDDEPVFTLSLAIDPQTMSENGGILTGTVTRTGPTWSALVVTLASSDVTEATVPATVTIPAGAGSVQFPITAANDAIADGTQPVTITASYQPPPVGLDTSFGTGGLAATSLRMNLQPPRAAVAVQPDGKIIAAAEDANTSQWRITRLLPGGGVDPDFGTAGVVTTPFSTEFPVPHKVLVQPDGKIIVGGKFASGFGTSALARYNEDGSPDPSFGVGGIVDTSSIDGWIEDIALQPDGQLLLAIRFNGSVRFRAARVSEAGVVEAVHTYNLNSSATSIVALGDGRFLLAGASSVLMSTPTGVIDTSFATGGIQAVNFGMTNVNITEMEIDALGRILVAATVSTGANNTQDFAIARVLPGGALDPTFGTGGFTITDFNGVDDAVTAMALAPDGRIILAGTTETVDSQYDAAFARYTIDGQLDPTFDEDGRFQRSVLSSTSERLFDAALSPDGKLIALHGWGSDFRVARYHTNPSAPPPAAAAIAVTDDDTSVNQPPTDVALAPTAVAENAPAGTPAGHLSTTDPNPGDTHTYALVAGPGDDDNAAFTLVGGQVVTNLVFDHESQSSYSIRVRSTDPGGLSVEKTLVITVTDVDEIAPTVTRVFLDSSNWAGIYRDHMQTAGIGSSSGFAIEPDAGGASGGQTLPWRINRIAVQFSEHVDVEWGDFSLLGVNTPDYAAALAAGAFSYDAASFTAVWTLAAPLSVDKLRLVVSGRPADAAGNPLDGNTGQAPDDGFALRFNLLPGDVNGNGSVTDDLMPVRQAQFKTTASPGYSAFLDVNGDGAIRIDDAITVRNSQLSNLPPGEPGFPAAPLQVHGQVALALEPPAAVAVTIAPAAAPVKASASSQPDLATMAALFKLAAPAQTPARAQLAIRLQPQPSTHNTFAPTATQNRARPWHPLHHGFDWRAEPPFPRVGEAK